MHVTYLITLAILSLLAAIPILLIFVVGPVIILGAPGLLWKTCKRTLLPTAPTPATAPIIPAVPIGRKPYKPRGRKSKITGIRKNRAILYIAKGGNDAKPTPTPTPQGR